MAVLDESTFVASFHAGDRSTLEQVYRACFKSVLAAASRILRDVDAETVTHEVFFRMLSDAKVREGFHGGNIAAWLGQIASRAAIDHYRRQRREAAEVEPEPDPRKTDDEVDAKMLIDRFREECLPKEWRAVFEARFLRQLPQRDAARELGIPRTTLVYQEQRIRALLEEFLLDPKEDPKERP